MSATERHFDSDLVSARVRIFYLEQDLSDALYILYGLLVEIASQPQCELRDKALVSLRLKMLQMPQGFSVGERLIDLDRQFGNVLETKGVNLEKYVYEARCK
jgi:hypothetical protein